MKEGKKIFFRLCRRVFFDEMRGKNFQWNFSSSEWTKNVKEVHLIDRKMTNKCFEVISGE